MRLEGRGAPAGGEPASRHCAGITFVDKLFLHVHAGNFHEQRTRRCHRAREHARWYAGRKVAVAVKDPLIDWNAVWIVPTIAAIIVIVILLFWPWP